MFQATFQNRAYSWTEFRPATPASINLGMDIARAFCNFGPNEGTSNLDSSRVRKESEDSGVHNGNIYCGAFLIDDLSEFSNEEIAGPIGSSVTQLSNCQSSNISTNICQAASGNEHHRKNSFEAVSMFDQTLPTCKDIYAPCNDITELEWLSGLGDDHNLVYGASNFVGDSFLITTEHEFAYGSGLDHEKCKETHEKCKETRSGVCSDESATLATFETSLNKGEDVSFEGPVPGRARSKRSRSGARSWASTFLFNSLLMKGFNSSSDLSNLIASSPSFCPLTLHESASGGPDQERSDVEDSPFTLGLYKFSSEKKTAKKSCRKKKAQDNGQPRRCAHCLSQKTPQWRAGPTGPKTLCNACGVRFKSGRLYPEYRPAKSPTFVSQKHSNSHKRVLEMRNQNKPGIEAGQGGLEHDLKVRFKLCATEEEELKGGLIAEGEQGWFVSLG